MGVTEFAMGCPIISSMEVVETGRTPEGIDTYMDKAAHEADVDSYQPCKTAYRF